MKVFVVSLKSAEKRRKSISAALESQNIDFEFFDAIKGAELSNEQIEQYCDLETLKRHPEWMNPGAIGCSLSHVFIYQKIIDNNLSGAVILEDDMLFVEGIKGIIDSLENQSEELIMLYYRSFGKLLLDGSSQQKIDSDFSIYQLKSMKNPPMTTGGYYISRSACERFTKYLYPIRMTADSWNHFVKDGVLDKIHLVYPRPLMDAGFKSEIEYIESSYHPVLGKIAQFVDRNQIQPFYGFLKSRRRKIERKMSEIEIG